MTELDALRELYMQVTRFRMTPPVDDDFPDVAREVCIAHDEACKLLNTTGRQFNLIVHLTKQQSFSEKIFGPGLKTEALIDHILKELDEIEKSPTDPMEWVDVVLLAFDGLWRTGCTPEQITQLIEQKQSINESRDWPDWRKADPNTAMEHIQTWVGEVYD